MSNTISSQQFINAYIQANETTESEAQEAFQQLSGSGSEISLDSLNQSGNLSAEVLKTFDVLDGREDSRISAGQGNLFNGASDQQISQFADVLRQRSGGRGIQIQGFGDVRGDARTGNERSSDVHAATMADFFKDAVGW